MVLLVTIFNSDSWEIFRNLQKVYQFPCQQKLSPYRFLHRPQTFLRYISTKELTSSRLSFKENNKTPEPIYNLFINLHFPVDLLSYLTYSSIQTNN